MNPYWSHLARTLSPYVPGEQPRIANLVKLNTNESPFGPSPRAQAAMQAAATAGGCEPLRSQVRLLFSANRTRSSEPEMWPPTTPYALEKVPISMCTCSWFR